MKKKYRIKKKSEIDAIFKEKKVKGDAFFVIYKKDHEFLHFRFALSIGKKFGKAVKRNLIKRQIRMIINELKTEIDNSKAFVIVIKPKSNTLKFSEIKESITQLLKKSKLLEKRDE